MLPWQQLPDLSSGPVVQLRPVGGVWGWTSPQPPPESSCLPPDRELSAEPVWSSPGYPPLRTKGKTAFNTMLFDRLPTIHWGGVGYTSKNSVRWVLYKCHDYVVLNPSLCPGGGRHPTVGKGVIPQQQQTGHIQSECCVYNLIILWTQLLKLTMYWRCIGLTKCNLSSSTSPTLQRFFSSCQ